MEYLLFEILYRGLNYEKMRTTKHIKSKQIIELRKHMALLKMVLHLVNAIYYKLGNDYFKAIKNNITSIIKNDPEYAVKYYHPLFINDNADLKSLKSKVLSIDERTFGFTSGLSGLFSLNGSIINWLKEK